MPNQQTIQLWGHWGAPNPWKVCMVLEVLGLPYDINTVELSETKNPSYVALNPNGRLPTIQDPNTGITVWESGAIILYLIDQYDKDGKISFADPSKKYQTWQWLMFQVSGQGPYFGQATWFARFHPEKIPSATERYVKEIVRVCGVLDGAVASTGWLVGDKCTFADISFITWAEVGYGLLKQLGRLDELDKFPAYGAWLERMGQMDGVAKCKKLMAEGRAAHGLP